MKLSSKSGLLCGLACIGAAAAGFDAVDHLGANSPWFPGPNLNHISPEVPDKCIVDQAVYQVRHGSRYPDPSAYQQWTELYAKIQSAPFTARDGLSFVKQWKPVLDNPTLELSQESLGGYKELYDLGVGLRTRYPGFYQYGSPFLLWSNDYPRVIDSARLFARGYIGPNSSLADVYVVTSTNPSAVGNSLATSDSCKTFEDSSGGNFSTTWDSIYLPPIVNRLNGLINGNFTFNSSDVSIMPYLCGFETQITGRRSPWCDLFQQNEILNYEYRQDLRYYYGTGPGAGNNESVQYPLLQGIVDLLQAGPGVQAKTSNGTRTLPTLLISFIQDNQVNELASILGVFDNQKALSPTERDDSRLYISSNITPMRGTVAFERFNCSGELFVRLRLNDAVYPVPSCSSGPGKSCPLQQYADLVKSRFQAVGSFGSFCDVPESSVTKSPTGGVTFFTDLTLPALRIVKP